MGDLLDEDDDANGGKHPLNDTRGEVLADDAGSGNAQDKLRQATNDHSQQEGFKADFMDAVIDNDGQAGSGPRDANVAA